MPTTCGNAAQYWERHTNDRPFRPAISARICAHEMYIILNTAIQAQPLPPSQPAHYPTQHVVDWVKVWEWVEKEEEG